MNRREHLKGLGVLVSTGALTAGGLLAGTRVAQGSTAAGALPAAADRSRLIYVTPIRADGTDSRCQSEVWFLREGGDLFVVTQSDTWRARAVGLGRTRARIWIGDVGVWSRNPEYRELPSILAQASLISDPAVQTARLEQFGGKYADEWPVWGPRFQKGLADGSRVMIRYRVA